VRGLSVARQVAVPIFYDGATLDAGYRLDIVVNNAIIMEVKSVDALTAIHRAQLMTYLKLSKLRLRILLNVNVGLFKQGIRRVIL